ncbi:MAG: hypothetical protein HC869_02920 [Rhodospirillales bacterium]|nr:hypothetical protein [Rhodospirillales bacterium]
MEGADSLVEKGRIVVGRGRGQSVCFTKALAAESGTEPADAVGVLPTGRTSEEDLYPHLKVSIEKKWMKRFALDDVLVAEPQFQGRKTPGCTPVCYLERKQVPVIFHTSHATGGALDEFPKAATPRSLPPRTSYWIAYYDQSVESLMQCRQQCPNRSKASRPVPIEVGQSVLRPLLHPCIPHHGRAWRTPLLAPQTTAAFFFRPAECNTLFAPHR